MVGPTASKTIAHELLIIVSCDNRSKRLEVAEEQGVMFADPFFKIPMGHY